MGLRDTAKISHERLNQDPEVVKIQALKNPNQDESIQFCSE